MTLNTMLLYFIIALRQSPVRRLLRWLKLLLYVSCQLQIHRCKQRTRFLHVTAAANAIVAAVALIYVFKAGALFKLARTWRCQFKAIRAPAK